MFFVHVDNVFVVRAAWDFDVVSWLLSVPMVLLLKLSLLMQLPRLFAALVAAAIVAAIAAAAADGTPSLFPGAGDGVGAAPRGRGVASRGQGRR